MKKYLLIIIKEVHQSDAKKIQNKIQYNFILVRMFYI